MRDSNGKAILVSGSTGFLGSLVVATALRETNAALVLPVREPHSRETVVKRLAEVLTDSGGRLT